MLSARVFVVGDLEAVGKVLRGIGNESDNGREAVDEDAVLEVPSLSSSWSNYYLNDDIAVLVPGFYTQSDFRAAFTEAYWSPVMTAIQLAI